MNIYTREQIGQIEQNSVKYGMNYLRLMENAGAAAARTIREKYAVVDRKIAVVCGRGNNGGDGYVVARKLAESGAHVNIVMSEEAPTTEDALEMFNRTQNLPIPITDFRSDPERGYLILRSADLIVDAIFGSGFHGNVPPLAADIIRYISGAPCPVVSLDLPSGSMCDSGEVGGACVNANMTVSFIALKPCHILHPASGYCGQTVVVNIGVPDEAFSGIETNIRSIDPETQRMLFGQRPSDCHKGNYGNALLVCGSRGMAGAAALSATAALRCGAGLVTLAVPDSIYTPLAARLPEPVFCILPQNESGTLSGAAWEPLAAYLEKASACLIGCGLGHHADTRSIVEQTIKNAQCPIVIDADGINAVADNINILKDAKSPVVLTPHPGEMARLCGVSAEEIQRSRLDYAKTFAAEYNILLVLKGAHTLVVTPQGEVHVNLSGNGGMATAGTGDMLAGMLVSFLAQGMDVLTAAKSAVYLHGVAGDRCAVRYSQRAMTPSDMINELPAMFCEYEQIR